MIRYPEGQNGFWGTFLSGVKIGGFSAYTE